VRCPFCDKHLVDAPGADAVWCTRQSATREGRLHTRSMVRSPRASGDRKQAADSSATLVAAAISAMVLMTLLLITSPAARAATPSPSPSPQPAPATAAGPAPDPTPQATAERSPSSASSNTSAPSTQAPVISSPAPSGPVSAPVTPLQSAVPSVSALTSTAPRPPSHVSSMSTHAVAPGQVAAPAVSRPGRAPARPKAPRLDAKRVSAPRSVTPAPRHDPVSAASPALLITAPAHHSGLLLLLSGLALVVLVVAGLRLQGLLRRLNAPWYDGSAR
jgi:hypothetical protein